MKDQKGKVIDFFSKADMNDHGQDTEKNDEITAKLGRFIGALSPRDTEAYLASTTALKVRSEQISAMVQKWEQDYFKHVQHTYSLLHLMGIKEADFDPEKQDVMVGEDGKVWIVDLPNSEDTNGIVH